MRCLVVSALRGDWVERNVLIEVGCNGVLDAVIPKAAGQAIRCPAWRACMATPSSAPWAGWANARESHRVRNQISFEIE